MVNTLKKNFSTLPAGKYNELANQSTLQWHQAQEGKRCLVVERVRALGALRSLRSEKKLSAEKTQEAQFLSNDEKDKWIEDYVEREIAVARKLVQDADTVIMQELKDKTTA